MRSSRFLSEVGDILLLLLNITNGGLSIIPLLLLFDNISYNLLLNFILNIGWCIKNSKYIRLYRLPKMLTPFFILLFYQIFLGRMEFSLIMFVLNSTFLMLLCGICGKYKECTVTFLSKSYISYSLINVVCVCVAYVLVLLGLLDSFSNSIDVSILAKDDEMAFFPGYLTVIRPDDAIRVSFLPSFGLFCGFSHEPHVVGYICIPAFFLLLYRLRGMKLLFRILFISLYILFFLITISATSFISLSLAIFVGLFMSGRQKGEKINWVILAVLLVLVVMVASFFMNSFSFVFDKLTATGGSKDYSQDRLSYALFPETFLGTTIYSTVVDGDIGVISALLNLWFYISVGILCFKMLKTDDKFIFLYGMMLFYFLCHSMKILLMIYRYPFTVFVVFLAYYVYNNYYLSHRSHKHPIC